MVTIFLRCASLAVVISFGSASATAKCACSRDLEILGKVATISTERDDSKAVDATESLSLLIVAAVENPPAQICRPSSMAIATLLAHRNDGVKLYAAAALAEIGLPAKDSLPALELALSAYRARPPSGVSGFVKVGSLDLETELEIAIARVQGKEYAQ